MWWELPQAARLGALLFLSLPSYHKCPLSPCPIRSHRGPKPSNSIVAEPAAGGGGGGKTLYAEHISLLFELQFIKQILVGVFSLRERLESKQQGGGSSLEELIPL